MGVAGAGDFLTAAANAECCCLPSIDAVITISEIPSLSFVLFLLFSFLLPFPLLLPPSLFLFPSSSFSFNPDEESVCCYSKNYIRGPWVAQLVEHPTLHLSSGIDLRIVSSGPTLDSTRDMWPNKKITLIKHCSIGNDASRIVVHTILLQLIAVVVTM